MTAPELEKARAHYESLRVELAKADGPLAYYTALLAEVEATS